jgi:hypothetical protein
MVLKQSGWLGDIDIVNVGSAKTVYTRRIDRIFDEIPAKHTVYNRIYLVPANPKRMPLFQ